jgi:hypothetical protein
VSLRPRKPAAQLNPAEREGIRVRAAEVALAFIQFIAIVLAIAAIGVLLVEVAQ